MSYKIGFIGGGNMSTAILKGILNKDAHPASEIWVSGPHVDHLQYWRDVGANVTNKNEVVFTQCDIIFLGIKPAMLLGVVKDLSKTLKLDGNQKSKLVISMLAGINLEKVQKLFKEFISKGIEQFTFTRIMPNVPMAIGSGACLYTPGEGVLDDHKETMVKLLSCCGQCEEIPETLMDSLGALIGCGPAFMFIVIEALADGAVKQGVPRAVALRMAAQMMMGSAHLVLDSKKHPGQLKDEVCSPGGSTIAGVSVLEDGKLRSTFIKAIEASTNKAKDLLAKVADSTV